MNSAVVNGNIFADMLYAELLVLQICQRHNMETLRLLRDYFPTAVFTGKCLVFISEDWRVELTEHKDSDFSKAGDQPSVIRIRVFKKALNGEFVPGHYEDFQLASINELAEQIEKYVQMAVGRNVRENFE